MNNDDNAVPSLRVRYYRVSVCLHLVALIIHALWQYCFLVMNRQSGIVFWMLYPFVLLNGLMTAGLSIVDVIVLVRQGTARESRRLAIYDLLISSLTLAVMVPALQ